MARAVAKTPTKGRSKSPPKTRSRTAKKAAPTKKRSPTPAKAPARRTASKKKQQSDTESEDSAPVKTRTTTTRRKTTKVEADDEAPTKLATRVIYAFLFVVGLLTLLQPEKAGAFIHKGSRGGETFCRLLGLALVALSLQMIAITRGHHEVQKRALQYGMFTWVLFPVLAFHLKQENKNTFANLELVVIPSIIALALSLWACYFS
uniref:Uncharacterized protein n=1 Tax=Mucochytrium quahogii TaxID=96639 RepID=A0A7S2RMZ7_9STRA|mmetsp:Transcript_13875/g.22650  ORF Transcript_13875/g.22650 Transcript_13875/m.22650 type:complete len:205 (+) Transcript_13875:171-785(+)|eukprot:CAMPEP_0203776614 /NCGR_PEP_ID=MMETSP0099_2-20121227/6850_1 /ASSEMBLY_ACC=CAM_ASM_000209 /TAXON_ID=96639 /ORGANISM=" , Strain NY0313808BC1" /LENGTH=204 /DNA_ID=CAMNT_0050675653 /DNA_START=50 /DNA_END=664 /DNA_ORIENTATION=-